MKQQTAIDLSNALAGLEAAREGLENASDDAKAAAADEYMAARAASSPIFAQAQGEYDLEQANASTPGAPPTEEAAQLPAEAAPGVPLVAPPGHVIDHASIERYGPLVKYWSKADPTAEPIEATPYAFAPGTAVATENGEVATAENSRIVRSEVLAVVPQAEFDAAFTSEDPANAQPEQGEGEGAPAPGDPAGPPAETEPPQTEPGA